MAALLVGAAIASYGFGWSIVDAKIRRDFLDVPRITTNTLQEWLADESRPAPLLLDVRTRAEYDVSHLKNAQHVEPVAPASTIRQPRDRPIVTYCSVGYRSGAFAQKLRAAGYTNVVNLEGSIFRWANEGRPVYRGATTVQEVHPYNRTWGLLLQRKYRASIPSKTSVTLSSAKDL
ncbi:MAG: rhodanese-like domain-containing protein [Chthoniobacterales bacterium]|nr:rhodanese-like domain-containing protein [Chthoniobacterales bacterium]